jgi:hypothetical protein
MTTYSDQTKQIGDQWVAAIKRAEDAVTFASRQLAEATAKVDVPVVALPGQITEITEAVTGNLPNPSEILEANFEFTTRLLAAQREFALQVLELNRFTATEA